MDRYFISHYHNYIFNLNESKLDMYDNERAHKELLNNSYSMGPSDEMRWNNGG